MLVKSVQDIESKNKGIACFGIDGKVDKRTFSFKTSVDGLTISRVTQPEHHLTFTNETDLNEGFYISHQDLPMKGILRNKKFRSIINNHRS